MTTVTQNRIEAIHEFLARADQSTNTLFDASKSLGALICAIGYLVEIIEEQQREIERLSYHVQDAADRGK